jgi:hypothetical protein
MKNANEKQSFKSNEKYNLSLSARINSTGGTVSKLSLKFTDKSAPVLMPHMDTTTACKTAPTIQHVTTMTPEKTLNNNDDDAIHEPWMQQYSTYTFEQLHSQVYEFIDQIVSQELHETSPQVM